ncbi:MULTISPECIES: methionyl aminopeptidase [Eubacterium]|uniref:Methionine aminopeptidase n=1 Tax=Eubacterium ruminantium TaxID=42322 RepID=A0A1T4LCT1_9FIRM|nr:methionyl aminopeptidase [Eubacterium ruminantium]SDM75022.1 methionyl aminopeptidase [Eubacterium ruminantium]SJZ52348.1 methionyl aminopeptidase [Eubacterium ruminantium]
MAKLGRNDACWCGSGKKYKACHEEFDRRIEVYKNQGHIVPTHNMIKNPEQIAKIKEACKVNVEVLDTVADKICIGMSTEEINEIVNEVTYRNHAIPAPLNYEGFPKSVCTSINDAVCHGIPSKDEILMDGDIINVDVSTILDGYFADSSRMFMMGNVSDEDKKLVEVTKEAMYKGLEMVKPWTFMGDMGQAVNDHAIANGYSVVREIGGHGVGIEFHEEPWVSYVTKKGTEILLVPGMIFTIEPMINMGGPEIFVDEENDWTVYTDDGSKSAQWEIQVLVTEDGHEVLSW